MAKFKVNLKRLIKEKELRENRTIRVVTIEDETNISRQTLTDWINKGEFTQLRAETVTRLCKWLECDIGDLIDIENRAPAA